MAAALETSYPSMGFLADAPSAMPSSLGDITQTPWLNPFHMSESQQSTFLANLREKPVTNKTQKPDPSAKSTKTRRRSSTKSQVPRDNLSPERARHLERNRVAANKCRLKKKKEHEQIQITLQSETMRHDCLVAELGSLREEIWHLKNQVFNHAKCDDQRINLQLAKMTTQILGNCDAGQMQCPSPTFSASTKSDAPLGENKMDLEGVSMMDPTEKTADDEYPGTLFDSFIDAKDF